MITDVKNERGFNQISFSFPEIGDRSMLPRFRDALLDALETCVSYKEAKEATDAYTLYLLTRMVAELNKDIENENEEKGGKV